MDGDYLLDTNIVIAFLKGETGLAQRVAGATSVVIPFVVLAELYYGARNSSRVPENLARIERLVQRLDVLLPDRNTLRTYGGVRSELRSLGRPIPEADIWIATLAIQHRRILVSRDTHFTNVPGLRVERW